MGQCVFIVSGSQDSCGVARGPVGVSAGRQQARKEKPA